MVKNESMEMYLETIYVLSERSGHAHVTEIAKELDVSKPSVTKAMNFLREKGMVDKEPYGSITLTDEGRQVAERVYRNHVLISCFLETSLGMKPEDASDDACRMEHIVSGKMIEAIEIYLKKKGK